MQLIVVSGRSGSGKTVALRVLEDLGYYCVDNLPVNLLPQLIVSVESQYDKLAVSIDVRNLPAQADNLLAQVRNEGRVEFSSFFFDADNGTLLKRYGESRRLHPLSRNKLSLDEAIREETHLLAPLSSTADLRIDTTTLSIHDLSELIKTRVLGKKENELVLVFESFGFKYGIPRMRTSCSTPVSCPTRTGSRSSSPSPARMSPWPTTSPASRMSCCSSSRSRICWGPGCPTWSATIAAM